MTDTETNRTQIGISREKAYRLVQYHTQNAVKENISFYDSLAGDKFLMKKISLTNLKKMFDINYHTKRIGVIFKRVFK